MGRVPRGRVAGEGGVMLWHLSHRADQWAVAIADRHYNRQKPGTPQFVPPGRCVVLLTPDADAFWVSSWPFAEYVRHEWAGAKEGRVPAVVLRQKCKRGGVVVMDLEAFAAAWGELVSLREAMGR